MKVPVLEQTEKINPTLINTPQISKGVPGAFGESVAQATERLGKEGVQAGSQLISHIQWQNYQKSMDKVYEAHSTLANSLKDSLYSTELEDVKNPDGTIKTNPDGTTQQQPIGIMNRQGFGAHDSAFQIKQKSDTLTAQIKSTLPQNALIQKTFNRYASSTIDSVYSTAVTHEATEWRKGSTALKNSAIANQVSEAALAQTPELLTKSISNVAQISNELANFSEMDDESRQKKINDSVLKTVQSAVLGKLNNTGSADEAHKLLDSVQKQIPPETYDALDTLIDKKGEQIKKQFDRQDAINEIKQTFDVAQGVASGKIDLTNPDLDVVALAGGNVKLGTALKAIQENSGEYIPEKGDDEGFQAYIKDAYNSKSQETINGIIIKALNAAGNKEISQDKLNIIIDAAMNHAKTLKALNKDPDITPNPKQNAIGAGVKSIIQNNNKRFSVSDMLSNFFKAIKGGKTPEEAHTEAVKSEVNRTNPLSVKYKIGDIITNSKGESAEIIGFNDSGSPIIKKRVSGKPNSNTK